MSNKVGQTAEHEPQTPVEPSVTEAQDPSQHDAGPRKKPRHRLRRAFLCIAASAVTATCFLLLELRLGMPLSFLSTLLLTLAVAVGLPLLLMALTGRHLLARGLAYSAQFVLICLLLAALIVPILLIRS